MNLSEHIICWQELYRAKKSLDDSKFETLIFRFVSTTHNLTKSSSKSELERVIETFRIQYYNKFMHNRSDHSKECVKFIEFFQSFLNNANKKKADYIELINGCMKFYKGSVGGSVNGVPLLCNLTENCLQSPQYFKVWYDDQVKAVRNQLDIADNRCAFCISRSVSLTQLRPGYCPANLLPVCGKCVPNEHADLVKSYLEKTAEYCVPAPNPTITQYLDEINQVSSDMAINPHEPLVAYKHRLDEHAAQFYIEHKTLKKAHADLKNKLEDLMVVQKHIVGDNEEYRISVTNLNRECSMWRERFARANSDNQRLISQCEAMKSDLFNLNHKFRESVNSQWYYYNLAMKN